MPEHRTIPWFENIPNERIAIVVAHPDDESAAFAGVLQQHPALTMIHVTDGAPEDPSEWKARTRREYRDLRQAELGIALDCAGHSGERICLGITDMAAVWYMEAITGALMKIFTERRTRAVCALAYEGGHPDHDAVAFAVHTAGRRMVRPPVIIEAPLYRMDGKRPAWQRFIPLSNPYSRPVHLARLSKKGRRVKRSMLAAYDSQHEALSRLSITGEPMREAPSYDFALPANQGNLSPNYLRANVSGALWSKCTTRLLERLA